MRVGTTLVAPKGWNGLQSGRHYLFLRNNPQVSWILLLELVDGANRRAIFWQLDRTCFEDGLAQLHLAPVECQPTLPPWLGQLEGKDIPLIELSRTNVERSNVVRAELRLQIIQPLLRQAEEMLNAPDPRAAISAWVRQNAPEQNPTRVVLWFACFIAYGKSVFALLPSFCRVGRWDRDNKSNMKKPGRPLLSGQLNGVRVDDAMRKDIEKSYLAVAAMGKSQRKIYVEAMRKGFGAKTHGTGTALRIVPAPGRPIPSFNQFFYWVDKAFDPSAINETIYGSARVRQDFASNAGQFSQAVCNVFEVVEGDAFWIDEIPSGTDGESLDIGLCVVRLRDVASGALVGIGFSLDGEKTSAYKMALFCAALPKPVFGKLFGLEINEVDWPMKGLPATFRSDRGSGTVESLLDHEVCEALIPEISMTPSYSPISKAGIESSHPRTKRREGAPLKFHSAQTIMGLVKRAILDTVRFNLASDVSSRMTPEMIADGVMPVPTALFSWLDSRARTSANIISLPLAIRSFLTPVEFKVSRDDLFLEARRFVESNPAHRQFRERLRNNRVIRLPGFAMDVCVRHAWLCIENQPIELEATLPIRDDTTQLDVPLGMLKQEKLDLNQLHCKRRSQANAAEMKFQEETVKATGKEAGAGSFKPAKSKAKRRSERTKDAKDAHSVKRARP